MWSIDRLAEVEKHLEHNPYLGEGGLPSSADAELYFALGKVPDHKTTPNTYYWYLFINSFSNDLMKKWIEAKPKPKPQEDDLFDETPAAAAAPPKPKKQTKKPEKKKEEKGPAKSIVVFDVKIYEQETDLDALAAKILKIEIDGLVWNKQPKKLDVAFGIQKLQLGCVIEDDKVPTDDIFQPIQAYEEVQSVDMVSMQKL